MLWVMCPSVVSHCFLHCCLRQSIQGN